ncbi:MAG: GTPase Era [Oscillospiraceae bacterium]|nr:GTPase Era [Oscillospiraceae bacterium]MBQ4543974.1 GTPase Era [Oscillospiraceae bacterium]MBQ6902708.1 GTPase Era [Oscillospiraceae bacterium]
MVAIVGRPNVGKSTLINALAGEKIAIVSDKPQTTRNRICGIINREETQYVFMDTPGFHVPKSHLGEYMVKVAGDSIADVDAVIMMVAPVANIGSIEEEIINRISQSGVPAILLINKIDTVEKGAIFSVIEAYSARYDFEAIIPVSAYKGDGLELIYDELDKFIPEGMALFPEDMTSDQPEKQMVAEIIREKLLRLLNHEIPHGTAVEITRFSERDNGIIDVVATIYCERDSHKGIIIGKRGAMLKKIGEHARRDIERFMGTKVFLETWVKVKENWRDNDVLIKNFGYEI